MSHARFEGTLVSWNDDRGFGYIESSQGGEPIFMHISVWPKGAGRPQADRTVSFEVESGPKGKRARNVQVVQARRPARRRRQEGPAPWGTATLFAIPVFLLLCTVLAVGWTLPLWVAAWYVVASAVSIFAYAADKDAAAKGRPRTPESSLHLLAFAGGWPGALLAQQFLRHKSKKPAFRRVFWVTVLLNQMALVVLASPWCRGLVESL